MAQYIPFTDEQKLLAASVDLERFLELRGEKLIRSGREKRMQSDHSVTIDGNKWYDHATRQGGNAVSFVRWFYNLNYPEAVTLLLGGETGQVYPAAQDTPREPRKTFALPPANAAIRRVFAYLVKARGINPEVVRCFARAGLLYEDTPYHNAVFVGLDGHGVARHAHLRSTNSFGKTFRINVGGSMPEYSFHHVGSSDQLFVMEAPIDMLSFITLHPEDWQRHSYVSLCGVGGQALHWMLRQYPHIKYVGLGLDNDEAGLNAADRHVDDLRTEGYQADILTPTRKDWNDDLTQGPVEILEATVQRMGSI